MTFAHGHHDSVATTSFSHMNDRRSLDQGVSATPTLHDEPVDVPLQEKSTKNASPEGGPDDDVEDEPQVEPARPVEEKDNSGGDILIVDWDGPEDPQNPRK